MQLETLRARLAGGRGLLDQFGVARLDVFGSVALGTATAGSDIDLLVEFTRPIGLIEFAGLQQALSDLVGGHVDLVTRAALKPQLRERILGEAVRAA